VKRVYWDYNIGEERDTKFPDDFMATPKKFRGGYSTGYDHTKCPAWKKWTENCWVVKQPFDVGIKVDTKERKIVTDLHQEAYDTYFHLGERWLEGEYPEIQLKLNYMFWTKNKDVWIEQIPHPLLSRLGFELIPGTFPISEWHRPLVVGLKVLDTDVNLMLKKNTPLYYFRLYSKKSDPDFIIEQKEPPESWHVANKQTNLLRTFAPFKSWGIIKQRVESGKCPIKWN
jgi:hypothetical protein